MNEDAAREYSESLGQIGAGWWRQVAWADGQGIPAALGMSTREWVETFVGGYMRMALDARREAVKELRDGTRTQQEIADILGVAESTVQRDLAPPNGGTEPPNPVQPEAYAPPFGGNEPTFDDVVESMQTDESRRKAAILRLAAAVQDVAMRTDEINPPLSPSEAAPYSVTLSAVLRRLNRGKKRMEVVS